MNSTEVPYSQIIDPRTYNSLMDQHWLMAISDKYLVALIMAFSKQFESRSEFKLYEIGSGPGRITNKVAHKYPRFRIRAIDLDERSVAYATRSNSFGKVAYMVADARLYCLSEPVAIAYSQGAHHHIAKGPDTEAYLSNVYKSLLPGGVYLLSDEVLAPYDNSLGRMVQAVRWYNLVVYAARFRQFGKLAEEEAKTLLDDLGIPKNEARLKFVLDHVDDRIWSEPVLQVQDYLSQLERIAGDATEHLKLSRGDHKVDIATIRQELSAAGFEYLEQDSLTLGPVSKIGGFATLAFRKPL